MLLSNEENPVKEFANASSSETDAATSRRSAWWIAGSVAGVVVLGLGLRYVLMLQDAVINEDGIYYVARAKKLMTGDLWNGISAYWSPLYSLLTGLVGVVVRDFELGGRIVSLLAGTLLIVVTYFLAARLYDKPTGVIASLLVAIHGSMILASTWTMTESLYAFLFCAMIASGWLSLERNRTVNWILTGVLFGLLYFTKPEALAFLIVIVLFAAITIAFRPTDIRKRVGGVVLMCFVVAVCVVPYVLFLHAKVGVWTLSKKVSTNLPSTMEEDQRLNLINGGTQTMMDQIWGDEYTGIGTDQPVDRSTANALPADVSPDIGTRFHWAFYLLKLQIIRYIPSLIPTLFLPFIIIGLFGRAWGRSEALRNLYLGAFVVATIFGYSFAVTNIRYLFAIIPLLLIFTAHGMIVFGRWAAETLTKISKGSVRLPSIVFSAALVVAILPGSISSIKVLFLEPEMSGTPFEERSAGLWLRNQNMGESMRVMSSHATVAYYAGAEHSYLPNEDVPTIIDYAKKRGVDFIVFSSRRLARNKNAFPDLPQDTLQDLELVYSEVAGGGYEIRIYKLQTAS